MPDVTPETADLRTRTREAMKKEVAAVAIALFSESGFDAVTTEQIARAAGISPRSFFRYFPTKEHVLLGGVREAGIRVGEALAKRPATESAWDALKAALRVLIEEPVYDASDVLTVSRILTETPSLRARELAKQQEWEEFLLPQIAMRLAPRPSHSAGTDWRASALIGAALSCMRAATQAWVEGGGQRDSLEILDELIEAVRS